MNKYIIREFGEFAKCLRILSISFRSESNNNNLSSRHAKDCEFILAAARRYELYGIFIGGLSAIEKLLCSLVSSVIESNCEPISARDY